MEKKLFGVSEEMTSRLDAECPGCGQKGLTVFYRFEGAPVHSVLLMRTRQEALEYKKGEIALGFCEACGLITNTSYDPKLQEYSQRCEETQGYSGTFNSFVTSLAENLIERYGLRGKRIIEIGCGKGEFLELLCQLGGNTGVGFDPAYVEGRGKAPAERVEFIRDFYSEKYSGRDGDFIVCRMTLEHISDVARFLSTVRASVGDNPGRVIFFQVPDVTRVLAELAFWDIYYEHCSYFTPGSLSRLFRMNGFEVIDVRTDYDSQYIMLEARPSKAPAGHSSETDMATLKRALRHFIPNHLQKIAVWKKRLREFNASGYRTAIWGSGSKGVAFLTTLGIIDEVVCAVDINPYRQGTFMPGTGHEIVSPKTLKELRVDAVIAMNPVYRQEIAGELKGLGISPTLLII